MKTKESKKFTIYQLTTCALFAAIFCIAAPNSIPIGLVPVTLTNLVLYVAIYLLGTKGTMVSYIVYLLLGIIGLPVFSGYEGGLGKIAGPTGGYLVGFLLLILISGLCMKLSNANIWITGLGMIVGTVVAYFFGTVWFIAQMHYTWIEALTVCVFPFIIFDLIKIVIGSILGKAIRTTLIKAQLLVVPAKGKKEGTKEAGE